MVYDPVITALGIVHGLIGVSWMGVHVSNELFLVPTLPKAEKLADAPMLRGLKKVSIVGMILGILTLVSGIIFMLVKFKTDFSVYGQQEPRTVVIALVLVVAVMVIGMVFLRPAGMRLGEKAATMNPMEPLPADFKADLLKVSKFARLSSALVTLAFIMMILAINGGI